MSRETEKGRVATITFRFSHFSLPPIRDALVVGKKEMIGVKALARAFEEMAPGTFQLIEIEHPVIEGVLVRVSDLRKIPEEKLIPLLISHAEKIMDETDSLHVSLNIEVTVTEGVELP